MLPGVPFTAPSTEPLFTAGPELRASMAARPLAAETLLLSLIHIETSPEFITRVAVGITHLTVR
jgi:hypothetical protein